MIRSCSVSAGAHSPGGMWAVERQTVLLWQQTSAVEPKQRAALHKYALSFSFVLISASLSLSWPWNFKAEHVWSTELKKKKQPSLTVLLNPWNMSGLLFHALTRCQAEVFRPVHILQKFKGRKSERKPEHMTLLKDTPQLAFCIGFAWKTPGAQSEILRGGDSIRF